MLPVSRRHPQTIDDPRIATSERLQPVFGDIGHVHHYGLDFEDRLQEAGFTVRAEYYRHEIGEDRARRYGLPPRRTPDLYLALKDDA